MNYHTRSLHSHLFRTQHSDFIITHKNVHIESIASHFTLPLCLLEAYIIPCNNYSIHIIRNTICSPNSSSITLYSKNHRFTFIRLRGKWSSALSTIRHTQLLPPLLLFSKYPIDWHHFFSFSRLMNDIFSNWNFSRFSITNLNTNNKNCMH